MDNGATGKNKMPADIEAIYDAAARFCMSERILSKDRLCRALNLDDDKFQSLLLVLFDMGVISGKNDNGDYIASKDYNHSDYLLEKEVEEDKIKASQPKPRNLKMHFLVLSLLVLAFSLYFLVRSPVSLMIVIPLSILSFYYSEKTGMAASFFLILIVCVFTLLWVNSATPIFGEAYERRLSDDRYLDAARKEKVEEMNNISRGEIRMKESLKDPSSAEIRNSRIGSSGVVCGQVNAKNSFGAYTGYKNYIQIGGITSVDDGTSSFEQSWDKYCN